MREKGGGERRGRASQSAAHTRDLLAVGGGAGEGPLSFIETGASPLTCSAEGRLRDACLEVGLGGWGGKYI